MSFWVYEGVPRGLRRRCGGIVNLAAPELEQDVRAFFTSNKIDLGG